MNTRELFGKEVLDSAAIRIGKVADIDFDIQKGIINHLVVRAGLIKKYVIILDEIDKLGDRIVLKIGQAELQKK
jgi:sporulation protein YlmC with PRC-barrel domain